MHGVLRLARVGLIGCAWLFVARGAAAMKLYDVDNFAVPTSATMLIYSPVAGALVLKNTASAIVAMDIASRTPTTRLATTRFTDMSLSPSGKYVFGADYGGENIGSGTPATTSYVHRLDLTSMTWDVRTAYIAGNVQAVSDTQVLLKSLDQWVTFTNNAWGGGAALIPLNTPSNAYFAPGYYASVYAGDFRYDVRTGRLLHGNAGLSSQEIQAFRIVDNEFVKQEASGVYGSAQGYGTNEVLATDGSAFYYGALQVDPLDVTHNLHAFPERIRAANGNIAFGDGTYYDAHTGALLGTLPFSTTVYAMNPSGDDFWAYDPATSTVHHFVLAPDSSAPCTYSLSPLDLSNLPAAGASPSITVITPANCPVPALSYQPWVTIGSVTPGGETTTVALQVAVNPGPARATPIKVADRLFLITQLGQ